MLVRCCSPFGDLPLPEGLQLGLNLLDPATAAAGPRPSCLHTSRGQKERLHLHGQYPWWSRTLLLALLLHRVVLQRVRLHGVVSIVAASDPVRL